MTFCCKWNWTAAVRACAAVSVLGATLLAVRANAQTEVERARVAKEVARVAGKLPAESQNVITRLTLLGDLPAGTWKMHAGDISHGEAANLDESGWTELKTPGKASNDAVWLRQTFTVPETLYGYDLTGARIWFQLHAYANGPMPQILYFNGRRVALGDDLEPVVLFDNAKPGEKVVVAIKLLHTVDTKTIAGATLAIDFPENRPNPEDLRVEFLSSAQLIPTLASDAQLDTDMGTLNGAIAAVDLNALDGHDQAKFDESLKAAQSKLEGLLPLMQTMTWHLTGNSHIDAAWLWPWTETVDVVKRTFGTALQLMYEYPNYTYTQSAAAYNEWMADKYPDMNDQIKQRIKEGRWEVVGGMWVEPDLNMPSGESLVRQLLVGKRWYQQHYGVDVRIGWNPDSFGYTWQLPQIYKKSGVDYFVTQKMTWNDTNQLPFKLFWWESPDGSKVLTYFPHDYANDNLSPVRLAADTVQARKRSPGLNDMMDLFGIGDHGGGPTRAILDQGVHWSNPSVPAKVVPQMPFGIAQTYFSSVEKEIAPESKTWNYQSIAKGYTYPTPVAGKISIPTWDTEMYLEYHRGVYTTQANHKQNMRDSEEEVLNSEKWASLAWLDGQSYPGEQLTEDWKKVLFNQFHDLAAGSGIGIIYKDAQKDYDTVRWSTNEISAQSLHTVAEHVDTRLAHAGSTPVIVWNPLGWERSGNITVTLQAPSPLVKSFEWTGANAAVKHPVHILAHDKLTGVFTVSVPDVHVPGLGYTVLHFFPVNAEPQAAGKIAAEGNAYVLENSHVRVAIDKSSGCITSLVEKKTGFNVIAKDGCGNQLQFYKDNPKDYDAWNIDPGTYDVPPMTISAAESVNAVTGTNGAPAVRVKYHWQKSDFVQTISLAPDADVVDVDNQIDWHESHILVKAAFPLAATDPFATYDIPYGTIQRATTRNNSWEKAQFEVPAFQWADEGDGQHGFSLLNQTKYGYDAVGNLLRLTLLRSPKWPDPDADMGHHEFHYGLYPHAGTWQQALTMRHGWEYNYPLVARATTEHAGSLPAEHSFASVTPENVVLTAVKKAEDNNGLIFRVYEWEGKAATVSFHVPPGATGATVTNLMEKAEGSPLAVSGDVVKAPIKPYEILTVRVDYPAKTE